MPHHEWINEPRRPPDWSDLVQETELPHLTEGDIYSAAALRAKHAALKLPEALVVATASVLGADWLLITDRGWPAARKLGLNAAIVPV